MDSEVVELLSIEEYQGVVSTGAIHRHVALPSKGRTPKGAYSPRGGSRHLLESSRPDPCSVDFGRESPKFSFGCHTQKRWERGEQTKRER